jgi:two-component system, LytTR family, sensor kinase
MFSNRYRYLFVLLLSLYAYINTVVCEVYKYFSIDVEWYYAFLTIVLITLFSWEGNRLLEWFMMKRARLFSNKFRYIAVFFVSGLVLSCISSWLIVWFIGGVIHGYGWEQNLIPQKLNLIYAGLINLFFHLLNAILLFFREYKKQSSEAEQLRRMSIQDQLQLVRNQVNPHFLFNNLNVLSALLIKTNPEANRFIEEFSKVYRYILTSQDKELVELEKELDFIHPYLFLLKKRFDEGLEVKVNVPETFRNMYIIPVALQMLIENAIKHNIISRHSPLKITVDVEQDQVLVVKNNLQPKPQPEVSTQIGLYNIVERYRLVCAREVTIQKNDTEFIVQLPLVNLN